MSKLITPSTNYICADCSQPDPQWASINHGVLICDDCCDIHRSLGRHISQVKSINRSIWPPTQLVMIYQLVDAGVNSSIWEYKLESGGSGGHNTSASMSVGLSSSSSSSSSSSTNKHSRRKPTLSNCSHTIKEEFIKSKYQQLAFINKQKDSDSNTLDDLSQQLHSAVRTCNLETSLRLLSYGAEASYFHQEKGNYCLHIAAKEGQSSQVELLIVYGADAGAFDSNGYTAAEYARNQGHEQLAKRITACRYTLTDRLTYFLSGHTVDHSRGQHFVVPSVQGQTSTSNSPAATSGGDADAEQARRAKLQLMELSNHLFEELAMDVYDEVDRRENESIWKSTGTCNTSSIVTQMTVPFLPMNTEFSATRNQARQKLAVFKSAKFAPLIVDILSEAKRRQNIQIYSSNLTKASDSGFLSDPMLLGEDPVYDSVAGDYEDYAMIAQHLDSQKDSGNSTNDGISVKELRQALNHSQALVTELKTSNSQMKEEILLLHNMVRKLENENKSMRLENQPNRRPQSMFESISVTPKRISKSASEDTSYSDILTNSNSATISEDSEPCPQKRPSSKDFTEQNFVIESVKPQNDQVIDQIKAITEPITFLLTQVQIPNIKIYAECQVKIDKAIRDMIALFPKPDMLEYSIRDVLNRLLKTSEELRDIVSNSNIPAEEITPNVILTSTNIVLATKELVTFFT